MENRDNLAPRGAVLASSGATPPSPVARAWPHPALQPRVRSYWRVAWDLPPGEARTQPVLTVPAVNLTFEAGGRAWIGGVATRRFDAQLRGRGEVVGVLFQPAGFGDLAGCPVADLTDRRVPAEGCLPGVAEVAAALAAAGAEGWVARLDGWLGEILPPLPAGAAEVGAWVALASADRSLVRTDAWAERVGVTVRTLQRRLREHVGVGPKWLLRRARLHDAAHCLAEDPEVDLTALALALGYFDLAHFARDFRAEVGEPPGRYAARCAAQKIPAGGVAGA